jgi:hypothetical protein
VTLDRQQLERLARNYTEAWCSRDPTRVAAHYVTGGTIAINGGEPAPITGVAESFVAAFPDIEVFMDDLVVTDDLVEYHWTSPARAPRPASLCASPASRSGQSVPTASSPSHGVTTTRPSTTDNFARVPQPVSALRGATLRSGVVAEHWPK